MGNPLKLLTITSLYPNSRNPNFGIFIRNRLLALRHYHSDIEHTVIAPVPWFPWRNKIFGKYAEYAQVPSDEVVDGVHIYHPKYLVVPKLGMIFTPFFMALSLIKTMRKIHKTGSLYDVIDGHYFYPDGVAVAIVGKLYKIPFTLSARGSDLNLLPSYSIPRKMIQWSAKCADHCITVSQALRDVLIGLGIDRSKITVIRNGVDLNLFTPSTDRENNRKLLTSKKFIIVSVGNLVPLKGHDLIIRAVAKIDDAQLFLIGEGPRKENLQALAIAEGVADRITFLGRLKQSQVAEYFQIADVSILASSREGWANVLLESLACGTPVIATKVGGNPEIIADHTVGILIERDYNSIVEAIRQIKSYGLCRDTIRNYAEKFDWQEVSNKQYQIFCNLSVSSKTQCVNIGVNKPDREVNSVVEDIKHD
ncbi:glycosyltransferase family 4 protein [Thalassotalea maritima]|uniref:glycosyltransferase family 4 protein n=1 Tax=Thalassotalea maritima TaxID=3242416 RepID=UPI0035280C71